MMMTYFDQACDVASFVADDRPASLCLQPQVPSFRAQQFNDIVPTCSNCQPWKTLGACCKQSYVFGLRDVYFSSAGGDRDKRANCNDITSLNGKVKKTGD